MYSRKCKPRDSVAWLEGGNANRAADSTENLGEYLKCFYANTHDTRNKQDDLEAFVSSQSCDTIWISEIL